MSEEPIEAIRRAYRYEMVINRKKLKNSENDVHRSLPNEELDTVDVSALASKLKSKSEVTLSELQVLKNLLIKDELNISLVLNTEGALRGIVREISGNNVDRKIVAAGCLCNLALGDLAGCVSITKAAGAYLVAALDSQNLELAINSAWALGNLCGAGLEAARLVARGGAVGALCTGARVGAGGERAEAAVYALTLFVHAMGDELSEEHLDVIVTSVANARCTSDLRLYFMLSCHRDFSDPEQLIENIVIRRFPQLMTNHRSSCVGPQCCDLVYAIRTLANLGRSSVFYHFLMHLREEEQRRLDFLELAHDERLEHDMLWLLGSMVAH